MNDKPQQAGIREIVVEEVLPYPPEPIWRAITDGRLIARWLMEPKGFEPVVGNRFTYHTTPAGAWDGTIHCEVLEVVPNERFVYAWKGGHESNVGYGALLDTVVTFTLTSESGGTRVRLVHSGFVLPRNEGALRGMGEGWKAKVPTLGAIATEGETSNADA
jgi:uncharacterized protein YndB with AHSA1/START domain